MTILMMLMTMLLMMLMLSLLMMIMIMMMMMMTMMMVTFFSCLSVGLQVDLCTDPDLLAENRYTCFVGVSHGSI